ncbi:Non-specific lipid-transfer protein-like protein [Morus notabilis]|uniref:Non-specific lipid-transfer protein-like protein n=1 Tax=Morus notabilis TaxID=981085 RepID=W9QBG8_9ROSA|nr:non-specific lipid-transfer protein-like protein At2g13820 [Morus notabilis]EXB22122.1 Non-specific lipid-transfer protein-like protein [Morus notabilis]
MEASRRVELGLALVLAAALLGRAAAQSGCTASLLSLSPCLNYITGNSSKPSSSCCSQLSSVVQSSPQCLCSVLNGGASLSLGFTINQTLALSLPGACQVTTPPLSQCKAANAPTASTVPQASSPAESPNETPGDALTPTSEPDVPLGGGSKSVPSTEGSSSDGSNVKAPLRFVLFLLFTLSCSSTLTIF